MKKVKFSQILDFQKKSHIKAGDGLSEGSFPFFTSSPVLSKYINISQFDSPSLIFGTGGSASIHICEKHFSVSTDCLVAQLKPMATKQFEIKFIYYYLSGNISILENGFKGAGLRHISKGYINNIDIPEISLEDQKRIVKILDRAEDLRQKRKQAIGLLDEYLKSVFLEMFGDPVKNKKGYIIQTINDVAIKEKHGIKAGPFGSSLKKEFYVKSGYKIYGQEQVIKDDFNYGDYYINEERYRSLESCKIQQGDILISLVGTFGKISVVPEKFEPGIINPRLMKITPNQNIILPLFLKELLTSQSVQKQIKDVSHGGTMGIVNVGIIKKIKILVPSLDEQKKYIELKEKIESVKQSMLTQSAELETQFQALIQKAFRGEL